MSVIKKAAELYTGYGKDREREVPRSGLPRFGYLLWNYFFTFLGLNLLFLLCCVPVITIPAALCALNRYLIRLFRDGYGFDLSDYWKEFRTQLFRSLPYGILCGFLLFYAYYLLSLTSNFEDAGILLMLQTVAVVCLIFAVLFGSYVFLLAAMLDLKAGQLMKNALILMICEWKASLLVGLWNGLMWGLFLLLFPYTVFLLLIAWFPLLLLMNAVILNPVIQKRIIEPYERLR